MSIERTETRMVGFTAYLADLHFEFTVAKENGYVLMDIDGSGDPYNVTPAQLAEFADDLKAVAKEASEFGLA